MEVGTTKKKDYGKKELKQKSPSAKIPIAESQRVVASSKKYILLDNSKGTVIIKHECLSHILDDNKLRRKIRFLRGAGSIFVDEQGDVSGYLVEAIVLENGVKLVSDPLEIMYLDAHDRNEANGGILFKEHNPAREASRRLESRLFIAKAVGFAAEGIKIEKLRAINRSLGMNNVSGVEPSIIREWAMDFAESFPAKFIDMVDSPLPDVIQTISVAIEKGFIVLRNNNSEVAWRDGGTFLSIPPGYEDNRIEFIARYLLDKGEEVLKTIKDLIKK